MPEPEPTARRIPVRAIALLLAAFLLAAVVVSAARF